MDLVVSDWMGELVEECRAILVEFGFRANLERVRMYYELGSRILQENENMERGKIYGQGVIPRLAKELGVSERTIQYAVAFAQKYPQIDWDSGELGGLPHGKAITWTKVIRELLPENPNKEKSKKACPNCGWLLT